MMMMATASNSDRNNVQSFCQINIKFRKTKEAHAAELKPFVERQKVLRANMLTAMNEARFSCVAVPMPGDAKTHYVRICACRNRKRITLDIILRALEDVISEEVAPVFDEVVNAVVRAIDRERVSTTDFLQVGTHIEHSVTLPLGDAASNIASKAREYLALVEDIRTTRKLQANALRGMKAQRQAFEQYVDGYMDRMGITSQRINVLEHGDCTQTYFIRKKRSEVRKKITTPVLTTLVGSSVRGVFGARGPTFEVLMRAENRRLLAASIDALLQQQPSEIKYRVALDKGRFKRKR